MQRLALLACLLVGGVAHAELTGTVVVKTNVSDVTCSIAGKSLPTKARAARFTGVPAGQHRLQCIKAGYRPFAKTLTVVGGQTLTVVASLSASTPKADDEKARDVDDLLSGKVRAAQPAAAEAAAPIGRASGRRGPSRRMRRPMSRRAPAKPAYRPRPAPRVMIAADPAPQPEASREAYDKIGENPYKDALREPLSTFSIDVDSASYANVRRFINSNTLPPKDAVRIEELINYFHYDYPDADGPHPFSVNTEISTAPWNPAHRLVHIGLQGKKLDVAQLPPSNLVFLLDVSGSMNNADKLPLLKQAFGLLVNNLRPQDRVAIVVYAGAAGLVLDSTPGSEKGKILEALNGLRAGGSTAGGAGIQLAYDVAKAHFQKGGNNRVILATDGDFNVGTSSDGELTRLIEEKRKSGVYLTILGFGRGNYQDAKMEKLSNAGNGNAAYIDSILEAQKVLVTEMGGTLSTIAKDVKIQVEFNPAKVKAYRLIGYVNRKLAARDFNDDKKDAGELGAGHTVTALYEIIPAGSKEAVPGIDALKYQKTAVANDSPELLTVKLRYKQPDGEKSTLIEKPINDDEIVLSKTSDAFRFSSAIAEFGMLLRDSEFKQDASYDALIARAKGAMGKDAHGFRFDFIGLAKKARLLSSAKAVQTKALRKTPLKTPLKGKTPLKMAR